MLQRNTKHFFFFLSAPDLIQTCCSPFSCNTTIKVKSRLDICRFIWNQLCVPWPGKIHSDSGAFPNMGKDFGEVRAGGRFQPSSHRVQPLEATPNKLSRDSVPPSAPSHKVPTLSPHSSLCAVILIVKLSLTFSWVFLQEGTNPWITSDHE